MIDPTLLTDLNAYIDGAVQTEEWDADVLLERCHKSIAAARREVETVTRERDGLAALVDDYRVLIGQADNDADALARIVANAAELRADLATARAAMEDVRRNNAVLREALDEAMGFLPASAPDACPECSHRSCERRRLELKSVREQIAMARSLKETRRALAQEAGDVQ